MCGRRVSTWKGCPPAPTDARNDTYTAVSGSYEETFRTKHSATLVASSKRSKGLRKERGKGERPLRTGGLMANEENKIQMKRDRRKYNKDKFGYKAYFREGNREVCRRKSPGDRQNQRR